MIRYLAGRLLASVPVLLGILTVVFLLIRLVPGDAIQLFLGTQVELTPAQMAELRHVFGVDKPIGLQYLDYLTRLIHADLGVSLRTARPVLPDIVARLPVSFELAVMALAIAVVIAIPIGAISALFRNSPIDIASRVGGLLGLSIPNFWLGTMLILIFSRYSRLIIGQYTSIAVDPIRNVQIMLLPAISLGVAIGAILLRYTRSSLLAVLAHDYVRTARSKGLREALVISRHAIPNALIPVLTVIGFQLGYLLGGTVVIEEIYALPGMGRLALNAIVQRDYPIVQGVVLVIAFLFVITNLLVDVLYAWIDPRIRYE